MKVFYRIHRGINLFLVNKVLACTFPPFFPIKRHLLNSIGIRIGVGTKVVGPIKCGVVAKLTVGCDCWIGEDFHVDGNGTVTIGDNCDIGPNVSFETGGHEIGSPSRRAGKGKRFLQTVGNGVWIGAFSIICNNTKIGDSSVVAAGSVVVKDVDENCLVGGVPAHVIKSLE